MRRISFSYLFWFSAVSRLLLPSCPCLCLCLSPLWIDRVRSSAGSSGSPRPLACERACDLCSGPLPASGRHIRTDIRTQRRRTSRRVKSAYSACTERLIQLVTGSMESVNCDSSICSTCLWKIMRLTLRRRSHVGILIIIIITCNSGAHLVTIAWARRLVLPLICSDTKWPVSVNARHTEMTSVSFSVRRKENTFVAARQQTHADVGSQNGSGLPVNKPPLYIGGRSASSNTKNTNAGTKPLKQEVFNSGRSIIWHIQSILCTLLQL